MSDQGFYGTRDARLFQGDIIRDVPHVHMKNPPLTVVRPANATRTQYTALGVDAAPGGFKVAGELVAAFAQQALAMVISYGCAIEHDPKHCLVALIRPLTVVQAEHQSTIRENK